MTPEQKAVLDAALAATDKVNGYALTTLVFVAFFMGVVVVLVALSLNRASLSLSKVTLQMLAQSDSFIAAMTTRSILANEQIRESTDKQTDAMIGQTNAITAMNQTGLATGEAVAGVDANVKKGLLILDILGVDVNSLAQHAIQPTQETEKKVQDIADKPSAESKLE